VLLPWRLSSVVAGLTGVRVRVIGPTPPAAEDGGAPAPNPAAGGSTPATTARFWTPSASPALSGGPSPP